MDNLKIDIKFNCKFSIYFGGPGIEEGDGAAERLEGVRIHAFAGSGG